MKKWIRPGIIVAAGMLLAAGIKFYFDRLQAAAAIVAPNYTQIEENLYMGGQVPAPPKDTHAVLNLSLKPDVYTAPAYQWSPIPDSAPPPTLEWLGKQVAFIEAQRKQGAVFVHCDAGISRSGLVITAYLMQEYHESLPAALVRVRDKREQVRPNRAFMPLLEQWDSTIQAAATRP